MPRADIIIDGTNGSNPPNGTPIVLGATVSLSNNDLGDESTYLWEFVDKPEGSLSAFDDETSATPTFVADSEGTFLIRLTVDEGEATEKRDQVIVGVAQENSELRIPAAGETTERSLARGWALDVNRLLLRLDTLLSDPCLFIGEADGALTRGDLVAMEGTATRKSGLPGEKIVPMFRQAGAASAADSRKTLYIVEYAADGESSSITSGDLVIVRAKGLFGPIEEPGVGVGDPIYMGDTYQPETLPGTYTRVIGVVADYISADATYYLSFDGTLGAYSNTLIPLPNSPDDQALLFYDSGAGAWDALPPGTVGQVLGINGSGDLAYGTIATGPDVDATVQTTNNTWTTIANVAVAAGAVLALHLRIACIRDDASEGGYWVYANRYTNNGGTITAGTGLGVHTDKDDASFDIRVQTATNSVDIQVLGNTGKTINWTVQGDAITETI